MTQQFKKKYLKDIESSCIKLILINWCLTSTLAVFQLYRDTCTIIFIMNKYFSFKITWTLQGGVLNLRTYIFPEKQETKAQKYKTKQNASS